MARLMATRQASTCRQLKRSGSRVRFHSKKVRIAGSQSEIGECVGHKPLHPEEAVVLEGGALRDPHECPADGRDGGTDDGSDQDVEDRPSKVVEPGRLAQQPAHGECAQEGHHAVGYERHADLQRGHSHLQLGKDVHRQRRRGVEPPARIGREQQGAEEDHIGRPKRRKYPIRQGADEECGLGPEQVGKAQQQRPLEQPTHARSGRFG